MIEIIFWSSTTLFCMHIIVWTNFNKVVSRNNSDIIWNMCLAGSESLWRVYGNASYTVFIGTIESWVSGFFYYFPDYCFLFEQFIFYKIFLITITCVCVCPTQAFTLLKYSSCAHYVGYSNYGIFIFREEENAHGGLCVLHTNICVMYFVWQHMIGEDKTFSSVTRALLVMEMNDNPVSVQVGAGGRRGGWDALSALCKFPKAYEYAEVSVRMCDYGNIFRW